MLKEMIKYRVWNKTENKFIYPVLDISNDFHSKYPEEHFSFDRFLFVENGVEFYQNDIVSSEYYESGRTANKKLFHSVLLNETHVSRFDHYLFRFHNFQQLYPIRDLLKYSARYVDRKFIKVGNVYENFDILVGDFNKYKQQLNVKKTN